MRWLVRIRFTLARRPWIVWLAAGGCALALTLVVSAQARRAAEARDAWGSSRVVVVAAGSVPAGTRVADAALTTRSLPVAALPPRALGRVEPDATVVRDLVAGEVLVPADVGEGDPRFALVPEGWGLVALALPDAVTPLAPGDHVQVTPPVTAGIPAGIDAVVISVEPGQAVVAVDPGTAPALAAALTDGTSPPGIVLLGRRGAGTSSE